MIRLRVARHTRVLLLKVLKELLHMAVHFQDVVNFWMQPFILTLHKRRCTTTSCIDIFSKIMA